MPTKCQNVIKHLSNQQPNNGDSLRRIALPSLLNNWITLFICFKKIFSKSYFLFYFSHPIWVIRSNFFDQCQSSKGKRLQGSLFTLRIDVRRRYPNIALSVLGFNANSMVGLEGGEVSAKKGHQVQQFNGRTKMRMAKDFSSFAQFMIYVQCALIL